MSNWRDATSLVKKVLLTSTMLWFLGVCRMVIARFVVTNCAVSACWEAAVSVFQEGEDAAGTSVPLADLQQHEHVITCRCSGLGCFLS